MLVGDGDPLAEQISWLPLRKEGATSHRTHLIVGGNGDRLEFRQTLSSRVLVLALLAAACLLPVIGGFIGLDGDNPNGALALIATGFVFGGLGVYFFFDLRKPRVFDRQSGSFYLGPHSGKDWQRPLSDIHALQIVSRYVTMHDTPDFYCHELNLVLKSGVRLNVIAHGAYEQLRDDAETLGQFLSVPVWDHAQSD